MLMFVYDDSHYQDVSVNYLNEVIKNDVVNEGYTGDENVKITAGADLFLSKPDSYHVIKEPEFNRYDANYAIADYAQMSPYVND